MAALDRAATAGAPAARHDERRAVAAACLATTLVPLGSTMVAVALPDVGDDFGLSVSTAVWLVIAYLVMTAAAQPIAGSLGDRLGRRRLVLGGIAGFGVASALAAVMPLFSLVILARCAQAVCGALALVNAAAIVRAVLPAARRGGAFGLIGASATTAAAAGPPVGGVAVSVAGWRATFLVALPLVALALLAAVRWLPAETRRAGGPAGGPGFDLGGAVLLLAVLATGSVFINRVAEGLPAGPAAALAATTVACSLAFVAVERRHRMPVLDVRVLRMRAVAAAGAAVGSANLALYLVLLSVPLLLAGRTSSVGAGALLAPLLGGAAVASIFGGRLSDRLGRRLPAMLGNALLAVAMLALIEVDVRHQVAAAAVLLAVAGVGQGLAAAAVQTAGAEALPAERGGVASGVWSSCRYLGSIVGTSLLAVLVHGGSARPVFVVAGIAALLSAAAAAALPSRVMAGRATLPVAAD